jgi:hypothetical protein
MASIADRFPRLRRLSPLLLVLGGVLVYFTVMAPATARDRGVTFRFQESPKEVTRIESVWTGIDIHPGDPIGGTTLNFAPSTAPTTMRTVVHAPEGDFWLELTVERGARVGVLRRRVGLDADEITVFVPAFDQLEPSGTPP